MGEENIIKAKFEVVPGLILEAHSTIRNIEILTDKERDLDKEGILTEDDEVFGHAARALVHTMYGNARQSPERQKEVLRKRAEELKEKYGDRILVVMAPELLDALGIKK